MKIVLTSLAYVVFVLFRAVRPTPALTRSAVSASSIMGVDRGLSFEQRFRSLKIRKSVVVLSSGGGRVFRRGPRHGAATFLPTSAFGVLGSLVTLRAKIVSSRVTMLA